ncbi:MAG: hypothetical protein J0L99_18715 [Chitinophagales bacterium]|nr:hypothetical protein [Chitinophagales bacterium]
MKNQISILVVFLSVFTRQVLAQQAGTTPGVLDRPNRISYDLLNLRSSGYGYANIAYEHRFNRKVGLQVTTGRFSSDKLNYQDKVSTITHNGTPYVGIGFFDFLLAVTADGPPKTGSIRSSFNQRGGWLAVAPKFYTGNPDRIQFYLAPELQIYSYKYDIYELSRYRELNNKYVSSVRISKNKSTSHLRAVLHMGISSPLIFKRMTMEMGLSIGSNRTNKAAKQKKESFGLPGGIIHQPEVPYKSAFMPDFRFKIGYNF